MQDLNIHSIYKKIYRVILTLGLLSISFVIVHLEKNWTEMGIVVFIGIFLCGLYLLKVVLEALKRLPGKIPPIPLALGLFLIIGGALFDIGITIFYSPDLSREANLFVRSFFNYGLSLKMIYCVGFFSQILHVTVISLLWAIFLKAYPIMLQETKNRWYFGLEWLGLVPISRIGAPTFIIAGGLFFYIYLSYRLSKVN